MAEGADRLTHVDESGAARMVDVSGKDVTDRQAVATGRVLVSPRVVELLRGDGVPKGDALAVARLAGIMGAKGANIVNLVLAHRDGSFHTFHVDVEVHDLAHLHGLVAALRAADGVSQVERI